MTPALRTLDDAERLDWLRLVRSENVGPRTFFGLLSRFGSARAALDALPRLAARAGRPIKVAPLRDVESEMEAARRSGVRFVASCEPAYAPSLRAIDSAPPMLAVLGRVEVLQRPMVAIVGSRNASALGQVFTERLARGLGAAGYLVVSGLARGIDASAHKASLDTGTVGVLAGGHQRIYPSEHAGLVAKIAEGGAVLSEMPLSWEPRGRDFPRRNRIVSGLGFGTVVVEAARRSGSLITARFAAEQGREVFAVPGSPLDLRAEGPNDLIREGATLCRSADDVLEALRPMGSHMPEFTLREPTAVAGQGLFWDELDAAPSSPTALSDEDDQASEASSDVRARLYALIGSGPIAVDDLVRVSAIPANVVQSTLMELELDGSISWHGGNAVTRTG